MSLADADFVLFTTYLRRGEAVSSPVWITALGDGRHGFYTTRRTGKTSVCGTRRASPSQPCSRRGQLTPGAAHAGDGVDHGNRDDGAPRG